MIHIIASILAIVWSLVCLVIMGVVLLALYKRSKLLKKIQLLIEQFDKLPDDLRVGELEEIKKIIRILDEYVFKLEVVSKKNFEEGGSNEVCQECGEKRGQ